MLMSITSILISQNIAVIGSYNPTTGEITTAKSHSILNNAFSKLEGKKVLNSTLVKNNNGTIFYISYQVTNNSSIISSTLVEVNIDSNNLLYIPNTIENKYDCIPQNCTSCNTPDFSGNFPYCISGKSGTCNMTHSKYISCTDLINELNK
jgi:hypothetical protein